MKVADEEEGKLWVDWPRGRAGTTCASDKIKDPGMFVLTWIAWIFVGDFAGRNPSSSTGLTAM